MKNYKDIELIERWKSNTIHFRTRAKIEEHFYIKFNNLVKSESRRYAHILSYEDNQQEAYLIMLKALEWVKLDKITNSEGYSFGVTFKYFLRGYLSDNQNYESFEKKTEDEMVSIYQEIHGEEYTIEGKVESFEEDTICKSTVNKFKSTLKERDLKIWNLLEEGKSQKDIKSIIGKSSVNYIVQKVKYAYIDFMNKNGYAIEC